METNTYKRKEEALMNYWILLVTNLPNLKCQTSKEVALSSITKILPAANRKPFLFSYITFLEKERKYGISVSAGTVKDLLSCNDLAFLRGWLPIKLSS